MCAIFRDRLGKFIILRIMSKPVIEWLINGESCLFHRHLKEVLSKIVSADTRDFNFDRVSAKTHAAQGVVDLMQTLPVAADFRTVVVEDVDQYAPQDVAVLCAYFKNPSPTTNVILVSGKADKRTSLYKTVAQIGRVSEFKPLYPNQLPEFVFQEARHLGLTLEPGCAQLLSEVVGNNLQLLVNELAKLKLFVQPHDRITREHISQCTSSGVITNVFELGQFIALRKYAPAHALYRRLQESGEPLLRLAALVVSHFRKLLLVKSAQKDGQGVPVAAGIPPFFMKDYVRQAEGFSLRDLRGIYAKLLALSVGLRSTGPSAECLFETFLQNVCIQAGASLRH